jgi:hypothetical protein
VVQALQTGTAVATLSLSPINPIKNVISIGKEGVKAGYDSVVRFIFSPWKWVNKPLYKAVMSTGTWKGRYSDGVLSMEANTKVSGKLRKVGQVSTALYTFWDKFASLAVAGVDYEYVKKSHPDMDGENQIKEAVRMWTKDINVTQSSGEEMARSQSSAGRFLGKDSPLMKALWTFQSDTVAGASILFKDMSMLRTSMRVIEHANRVIGSDAGSDAKDYAREMLSKATSTRNAILRKRLPAALVATLIGAIIKYLIEDLNKRARGRKEWNEPILSEGYVSELVNNSLESIIPLYSTIYSAINYNSGNVQIFALSGITDVLYGIKEMVGGKPRTGIIDIASGVATVAGVPVKNIYSYTVGFASSLDPKVGIDVKDLLYRDERSASSYSQNFRMGLYERVGEVNEDALNELISLNEAGYSVKPSAVPAGYEDAKGNEIAYSWTQKQAMRHAYSKANAKLAKMVRSSQYRQLSDEEKAYAISKLYSAYRDAAEAKVAKGGKAESVLSALALRNYYAIDSLIGIVSRIKYMEPTETASKKERAVAYVNSVRGLSKDQRLLALMLAGYSVDGTAVRRALRSAGLPNSDITSFLE